ncbi:MAG: terminase large subunit, partial [Chloroflexi bacterium]|nr:terminase large subunit [Chloroflexota bacterium]
MRFSAEQYVDDVIGGTQVACRWVKLACERHRRDLETGHERGLWFDERAAMVAIAFFSVLRHWKGEWAGRPIVLEPAQQFWLWSLFGWKREDGTRRFRTAYLEVARKNAKTTTAAGAGIYLAFVDGEPGAEVYSAATKRDQARISHRDATEMVRRSPQLNQRIGVFRDNLHDLKSGSKFEPLSADFNSQDGLNIHGVVADELHAWKQPELWGVLKTGTGSRRQPLMLA